MSEHRLGRPSRFSALGEADRTRWARVLAAAEGLSCEDTPIDFGQAHASAAFSSVDDLREQCDREYLQPLRSLIRSIRSDSTQVYPLDDADVASLFEGVDRAVEGTNAALEPVWRSDGSATMRLWRGGDAIRELTRALKNLCL
jgi:hypothetical protein